MDLVADLANGLQWLPFWIGDRPIHDPQSWDERTRFSATHGHQNICVSCKFLGELLRFGRAEVDADLLHYAHNFRMHATRGFRSGRDGAAAHVGIEIKKGGCHLRAPSIVNAGEYVSFHFTLVRD